MLVAVMEVRRLSYAPHVATFTKGGASTASTVPISASKRGPPEATAQALYLGGACALRIVKAHLIIAHLIMVPRPPHLGLLLHPHPKLEELKSCLAMEVQPRQKWHELSDRDLYYSTVKCENRRDAMNDDKQIRWYEINAFIFKEKQ